MYLESGECDCDGNVDAEYVVATVLDADSTVSVMTRTTVLVSTTNVGGNDQELLMENVLVTAMFLTH